MPQDKDVNINSKKVPGIDEISRRMSKEPSKKAMLYLHIYSIYFKISQNCRNHQVQEQPTVLFHCNHVTNRFKKLLLMSSKPLINIPDFEFSTAQSGAQECHPY